MTSIYYIKKFAQLPIQRKVYTPIYFLGLEYNNFRLASSRFPHLQHLREQREKMCEQFRQNLINLDENIPDLNPLWLASDLAENNLCLENFSLYVLNSLALIKETENKDTDVLVICDNEEQVFLYSKILKANGFEVNFSLNYGVLLKRVMGMLWQKILKSAQSLYQIFFLKMMRIYHSVPVPLAFLRQAQVWCINWSGPDSFNPDTLLVNDRYFGDLFSYLKKIGLKCAVIGKSLDFVFPFREIVRNSLLKNKNAVFLQDFLSIKDVFVSFVESFLFLRYINYPFKIGEVNFSILWKWFCFKDAMKGRIPAALEVYYASRKICKNLGKSLPAVIYPYENQPWEKLLCLSFWEHGMGKKVFAYQHFPFAKNYVTSYPSRAYLHKNNGSILLLSDNFFGEWLKEVDCKNSIVVGNFRFQKIYQKEKEKKKLSDSEIKNLLCCTSIQLNDSLELVSKVVQILEKLDVSVQRSIRLVVNFHPYMAQSSRKVIKDLLIHKEFESNACDLSVDDLIDGSYLIFYNSASVCFNAAMRGIPAIFIGSDLYLNLDRMPSISFDMNNPDEGVKLLSKLLQEKNYYEEICYKYKFFFRTYYQPPHYKLIQDLLTPEVSINVLK